MMPGKAGPLTLTFEMMGTPIGGFILVADEAGVLRAAEFADCEARLRRLLDRRLGSRRYESVPGRVPKAIRISLDAYFGGDITAIRDIPVQFDGTAFQAMVWSALRAVAPGNPLGYAALARKLGHPRSARAVGHANGANPVSIIVPCHRLVGADGALTGYGGGIERKRWLLDHEARYPC